MFRKMWFLYTFKNQKDLLYFHKINKIERISEKILFKLKKKLKTRLKFKKRNLRVWLTLEWLPQKLYSTDNKNKKKMEYYTLL